VCIAKKECKQYEWCWKSGEWSTDCGSESVFVHVGMKGWTEEEEEETQEKKWK